MNKKQIDENNNEINLINKEIQVMKELLLDYEYIIYSLEEEKRSNDYSFENKDLLLLKLNKKIINQNIKITELQIDSNSLEYNLAKQEINIENLQKINMRLASNENINNVEDLKYLQKMKDAKKLYDLNNDKLNKRMDCLEIQYDKINKFVEKELKKYKRSETVFLEEKNRNLNTSFNDNIKDCQIIPFQQRT